MRFPGWMVVRIALAGVVLGTLMAGSAAGGQQLGMGGSASQVGATTPLPSTPKIATQLPSLDPDSTDPMMSRMENQQAKSRNADRQKKLQLDTEKLLALATELKQQVDKTDKNILSVDVIKKAEEIEKLAKSVKDRMKG